jgi:alkylated DNA repair dioxygenase AlkB
MIKNLDILYESDFLLTNEAKQLFEKIKNNCFINNKILETKTPRLIKWYGNFPYVYSNIRHEKDEMPFYLSNLMEKVNNYLRINNIDSQMNSLLINYYRNGQDKINYHSDNEEQLGSESVIVSISLGDTRIFKFKNKLTKEIISYELKEGDLVIMKGETQKLWQHAILPEPNKFARINLTFRNTKYPPKLTKEKND